MERLFKAFERAGKELFLVGGAVRELARGIPFEAIDDLDFCTNALPEETLKILEGIDQLIYDVGIEFGTVGTVLYHDEREGYPKDCQITTYRSEEYYRRGSRHPQVRYGETLMQDLKRRDFSINSIAMNAAGEYVDPYDGRGDLERGIIRVVGDPLETLAEDPLRILRVGRFIAKLGFDADEELASACRERARNILEISRERWLQEMTKLLVAKHSDRGLRFLHEVEILAVILPEVERFFGPTGEKEPSVVFDREEGLRRWEHTLKVLMATERQASQRWAALLIDVDKGAGDNLEEIENVARRFKFDNATTHEVKALVRTHGLANTYQPGWDDPRVRRLVRELDPYLDAALAFARADVGAATPEEEARALAELDELEARIRTLEDQGALRPDLPSGFGNEVIDAFGLKPGRIIGQIKEFLEEEMLDGSIAMELEASNYIDYLRAHMPSFLKEEILASGEDGE
jgi:poly(A) polymerase